MDSEAKITAKFVRSTDQLLTMIETKLLKACQKSYGEVAYEALQQKVEEMKARLDDEALSLKDALSILSEVISLYFRVTDVERFSATP